MNKRDLLKIDDVYYYGYKEPLKKFTKGYGYYGALAYSKDLDKVQCHFCGRFFNAIRTSHTKKCCGLDFDEYKEATGLAGDTALVGEGTRAKMIRGYGRQDINKRVNSKPEEVKKKIEATVKANKKRKGKRLRLETKNKRGNCPDQLIEKLKELNEELGRVPTKRDFREKYEGRFMGTIYQTFGSWTEALLQAGLTPQSHTRAKKSSSENLCKTLSDFYERFERVPTTSDMKRGLIPYLNVFRKRFSTLNHARAEAGIPLLVQITGNKFIEYDPTPEEREKLIIEAEVFRMENNRD